MSFQPSPPPLSRLNPLQVSLDHGLTDEQTRELKRVLATHYSQQLHQEVERVNTERGYTADDIERMLNAPS